jgi:hypothetical protein
MKLTPKLMAIQDILMDPDFQRHKLDGVKRNMGYAHPGKSTITQHSHSKKRKKHHEGTN